MLIDAHAHLDRYGVAGEPALDSALAEIARHRILTISNSMDLPSYRRNVEISGQSNLVVPCFGVHPWNAPAYADRLNEISGAVLESPLIGEIGLDHHFVRDAALFPAQRKVFEFFLQAAGEQKKIVILHTKGAEEKVVELLEQYSVTRAIVHWYSGSIGVLRKLSARGAYFTVGTEIGYSDHLRMIAREIPTEQLLTETDNPGGPKAFIGESGMPALIQQVVDTVAEVRGTTADQIVRTVQSNLLELFRSDRRLEAVCRILRED